MESWKVVVIAAICFMLGGMIIYYFDMRTFNEYKTGPQNTLELILENANCPTGAGFFMYNQEWVAACSKQGQPIKILRTSFSDKHEYEQRNYTCGRNT